MLIYGKFSVFLCSLFCVVLHEMGHSLVGKKLGYKLNIITLMPYGAMLSGNNSTFSKDDEIKIAIAGPLVNAILIIMCVAIWWIFPTVYNFTTEFVMCNIYTLCFNLLPVYPLDGGRIFFALLSKKIPRRKAHKIVKIVGYIITTIFFVLFFVSFFYKLNYMLGINALFMLIGLIDDDKGAYYEKLTTFEKFQPIANVGKIIKLDKSTPIFVAYKKIVEEKVSKIFVQCKDNELKQISKNQIQTKILDVPIDTALENII